MYQVSIFHLNIIDIVSNSILIRCPLLQSLDHTRYYSCTYLYKTGSRSAFEGSRSLGANGWSVRGVQVWYHDQGFNPCSDQAFLVSGPLCTTPYMYRAIPYQVRRSLDTKCVIAEDYPRSSTGVRPLTVCPEAEASRVFTQH